MAKTNQRGRNNNNAEGRNQYSNGWKDRPMATAAAAVAAVGAGVFLWSRRGQISEQFGNLSDQVTGSKAFELARSSGNNRTLRGPGVGSTTTETDATIL